MIAGHYATALVPYALAREERPRPFWIFLITAQFTELLMLILVQLGIEHIEPTDFLSLSFGNSRSDMWLTHDIVPAAGWAIVAGLLFGTLSRDRVVGLWCAGLVVVHELCDLLVGYEHHWMGAGSGVAGLNLYQRAPVVGLLIEAGLCAVLIMWFLRHRAASGRKTSRRLVIGLFGILVGGTLASLPIATHSISEWLQ